MAASVGAAPARAQSSNPPSPAAAAAGVTNRAVLSEPAGRFLVVGPNHRDNLVAMSWADSMCARVGRAVGIKPAFANHVMHLVVGPEATGVCRVAVMPEVAGGRRVQRVVLAGYPDVNADAAAEVLCRALLHGYMLDAGWRPGAAAVPAVPEWLAVGLAENLSPARRGANGRGVLAAWEQGKLPPLADLLRAGEGGRSADRAAAGVLVGWLLSFPNRAEVIRAVLRPLAENRPVTVEWLAACVPDANGPSRLTERWEDWILRQKRIVYELGVPTWDAVAQLRAELLLYPGESGIPLGSGVAAGSPLSEILAWRGQPWLRAFVGQKTTRLQALAAGRGPEFLAVADAYGEFLAALLGWTRERRLREVLRRADGLRAGLEARLGGPEAAEQAGRPAEGPAAATP